MPTYYFCDQHKKVFESKNQMVGHWNFMHPGEERPEDEALQTDEKIDGYEFMADRREERAAERRKAESAEPEPQEGSSGEPNEPREPRETRRATSTRTRQPEVPQLDPDALKLKKILTAVGVDLRDVTTIVNGFIEIPYFRQDPNALHRWLDTHITTNKLKMYIPLAVNEVFSAESQTPFIVNPRGAAPFDGGIPNYKPSGGADAGARYGYYSAQPATDPEVMKRIDTLQSQVGTLASVIQEERKERERERIEREMKDRENATNARLDKMEALIISVNTRPAEVAKDDRVDKLLDLFKQLRVEQQDQRFVETDKRFDRLESLIAASKAEVVGKTAEDLVAGAIPIVADKVDKMGDRLTTELKGLREQIGPTVKDRLAEVAAPRTIEEIADAGRAENDFLDVYNADEAPKVATEPVEAEPTSQEEAPQEPEDPALARMPTRR